MPSRLRDTATLVAAVVVASAGLTGCSSATNIADLQVGDCLALSGTADHPEATKAVCGSQSSNFKVVAVLKGEDSDRAQCPADVDSSYSMRNGFSKSSNTACLDIDWVVGGCMSRGGDEEEHSDEEERRDDAERRAVTVDPEHNTDPVRVDCNDSALPHRQRATQILPDVADVDQCASGLGYAYNERRITVCVENVG